MDWIRTNLRREAVARLAELELKGIAESTTVLSRCTKVINLANRPFDGSASRCALLAIKDMTTIIGLCDSIVINSSELSETRSTELLDVIGNLFHNLSETDFGPSSSARSPGQASRELLYHSMTRAITEIGMSHENLHQRTSEQLSQCAFQIQNYIEERSIPWDKCRDVMSGYFRALAESEFTWASIYVTEMLTSFWKVLSTKWPLDAQKNPDSPVERLDIVVMTDTFKWLLKVSENVLFDMALKRCHGTKSMRLWKQLLSRLGPDIYKDNGISEEARTQIVQFIIWGLDYLLHNDSHEPQSTEELNTLYFAKSSRSVCLATMLASQEPDDLVDYIESIYSDSMQISAPVVAYAIFDVTAAVAVCFPKNALGAINLFRAYILQAPYLHNEPESLVIAASERFCHCLKNLSQDAIITTLYSLANTLSTSISPDRGSVLFSETETSGAYDRRGASAVSLSLKTFEQMQQIYLNVVDSIAKIAQTLKDDKIISLVISILSQKVGKFGSPVDYQIVVRIADIALVSSDKDFRRIMKLFANATTNPAIDGIEGLIAAVHNARMLIASEIDTSLDTAQTYLVELLQIAANQKDEESTKLDREERAEQSINYALRPLATLFERQTGKRWVWNEDEIALFRNMWINCVMNGFHRGSPFSEKYEKELEIIACATPRLFNYSTAEQFESDLDLNSVLRAPENRRETHAVRNSLILELPTFTTAIRLLSHANLVILATILQVGFLRAQCGKFSSILQYFDSPFLSSGELKHPMKAVLDHVLDKFMATISPSRILAASRPDFTQELQNLLILCCDRRQSVRKPALSCANTIFTNDPARIATKDILFTLLELLSLLWIGCADQEMRQYTPRYNYTSSNLGISLELSDDYSVRQETLNALLTSAREWLQSSLQMAPMILKSHLHTYLAIPDDSNIYDCVALGRSLAIEVGQSMPRNDSKMSQLPPFGGWVANTSSEFIAEYTARQLYRRQLLDPDPSSAIRNGAFGVEVFHQVSLESTLSPPQESSSKLMEIQDLEQSFRAGNLVVVDQMPNILRKATSWLLSQSEIDYNVLRAIVRIPFFLFNTQSIKLGISLWTWVTSENPSLEVWVVSEVARNWRRTIARNQGLFDSSNDPGEAFDCEMKYAPSDQISQIRQGQAVNHALHPHFLLINFLHGHYHVSKFGELHKVNVVRPSRMKDGLYLANASSHANARELIFRLLLLGFRILRIPSGSAFRDGFFRQSLYGLAFRWFSGSPKWTFGSNRSQIYTDIHLLKDLLVELKAIPDLPSFSVPSGEEQIGKSYEQEMKHLLRLCLHSELARLQTWLDPVERESSNDAHQTMIDELTNELLSVAWEYNASLAISLASRYPANNKGARLRQLIRMQPYKICRTLTGPQILLAEEINSLGPDHLKYLLHCQPVPPVTAITYFHTLYEGQSLILQYALRSLNTHPISVTFFYVPQVVQALRYDMMGYVERFIIEAGKISQKFAHQIIWNIKANSYKDEESQIPDIIEPTLDRVAGRLVHSFSDNDREFYEREFSFFNEEDEIGEKSKFFCFECTKILAKIDEEMADIKVDIGVYLPSNPDGEVIDIDRRSGRPLQSHAKAGSSEAPFMATFLIRKPSPTSSLDSSLLGHNATEETVSPGYIETWQSAIFKVGDDCRQDVLALQLISTFRTIFQVVGLDLYVFPYRVTATAPGCGVIDVLPNSVSRDMMGRESVNGMLEQVAKFLSR
ncbi:Phosphatidylinositol 4-kinase stt4 [Neolecta irregularis DAH-3]|uniref:1-phosphatidylinositol 4-kinase n=1 Tax=Neolecta irregularis (strain DAH-3) TaxID=1198029 RepID=A0A1U7LK87_NEOID|nr:Phosphatidylinositol 4-kinase stt4 [Neolecta irregularis DAH-3]|eukprot:OLL23070.1 Phosphatidylinositol 4-kinase stt4 [Neolecta irregularis DAH-3]